MASDIASNQSSTQEFEDHLARRQARRRILLAAGVAIFIGVVAAPYFLMKLGSMKHDTFEIFVVADLFVLVILVRALFYYLRDRTALPP